VQIKYVNAAGINTRCLVAGSPGACPILMLHGYGGTADIWVRNIDALGSDFYVVAVDMLNCGFTDIVDIDGPPTRQTVDHLVALVDALGFKEFCAMGTSYGSLIGALLYFAMPSRVTKLVLNGSGSCFNDDEALIATFKRMLTNFGPLMESPSTEAVRGTLVKQVYDPKNVPEDIVLVMASAYARPGMNKAWIRGAHGLMDLGRSKPCSVRDRLHELNVETLVVWGREDPGAVYAQAQAAVPRMPKARLSTFEQCGHKPMLEWTDKYNQLCRTFLTEGLRGVPGD